MKPVMGGGEHFTLSVLRHPKGRSLMVIVSVFNESAQFNIYFFISPALVRNISWELNEGLTGNPIAFELWGESQNRKLAHPKPKKTSGCKRNRCANIHGGPARPTYRASTFVEKALHITQCMAKACDTPMPRRCTLPSLKGDLTTNGIVNWPTFNRLVKESNERIKKRWVRAITDKKTIRL